jgi:hypothetical protein
VGGGAEDSDELAATPGRFESEEHAASANEAAEPMRKFRRESGIAMF